MGSGCRCFATTSWLGLCLTLTVVFSHRVHAQEEEKHWWCQDLSVPRLQTLREEKGINVCFSAPYYRDGYNKHNIKSLKLQYVDVKGGESAPKLASITFESVKMESGREDGCERDFAMFQGRGSDSRYYRVRISWSCFALQDLMPPGAYNVYVEKIIRDDDRNIIDGSNIRMKYQENAPDDWDALPKSEKVAVVHPN